MALMVSVSGIRGIFGTDLHPENLAAFTAAYGTWLGGGTVIVGRDTRVTGQLCEQIVCATLQATGCNVISVGIATTPTVAMAVLKHGASGGIILSASHNPAQWNALKLLNSKSEFLAPEEGKAVVEIMQNKGMKYVSYDRIGSFSTDNEALDYHVDKILALPYLDVAALKKRKFKVLVDVVNGAGAVSLPYLLSRLEAHKIHLLNGEPTGLFAHNPEPLPEHLGDICSLMKKGGYDIGFVVDPDADRLAVIDENGELWGEEYTCAATADFYLAKRPGPTAVNLSSSMINDWVAAKYGQVCFRGAVGEINVVKEMQARGAVTGGEGNGGVIHPDLHSGRDALVGIALILQLLAERNLTASTWRKSVPDFFIRKNRIELGSINADAALQHILNENNHVKTDTRDGVKLIFEDGWVHIRKSNTEPIIRIYSEASSPDRAQTLADTVMRSIQQLSS
jgi:phosphomannomutase